MLTRHSEVKAFITKDGSEIRELIHPQQNQNQSRNQSLAEATVFPGRKTLLHKHNITEEIYHITHGKGVMHLGGQEFTVQEGDSVLIPPGTPHRIFNDGTESLKILCCCSPAYQDSDTELLEN